MKLENRLNTGYLLKRKIIRTLKLLGMNSVQVGNRVNGSNAPHDVDEGIDVTVVKDKVVVHRVDREQQVESVEHPVQVIRFKIYS